MFFIVPALPVHVLYCDSGKCTCFLLCQRYLYMVCIMTVVGLHFFYCASGTCTCFVLCQRYVYRFCFVSVVHKKKSLKIIALGYLLFYVHPQVTKSKLRSAWLTWCCIDDVTKQNISHDAESRLSSQDINSLFRSHFAHESSPVDQFLRELNVVHIYTYYFCILV